jgi:hypothetical protein
VKRVRAPKLISKEKGISKSLWVRSCTYTWKIKEIYLIMGVAVGPEELIRPLI